MVRTLIINLGNFSHLPVNKGSVVQVKGVPVVLFRSSTDNIYCFENKKLTDVNYVSDCIIKDDRLILNNSTYNFDLFTGEAKNHPNHLKVFHAWIEHGNVLIQYTPLYIHDGNIQSTINN